MRPPALLLTLLVAVCCFSQEPIRVKVNLVNVSFSVRDSRGALVDNLTKDDFEVLEDAIPQEIAFFSRSSDAPLTLGLIVDASGSQEHYSKQHKHDLPGSLLTDSVIEELEFLDGRVNSSDMAYPLPTLNTTQTILCYTVSP